MTDDSSPFSYTQTQSGQRPSWDGNYLITNADQGAVMSWEVFFPEYCAVETNQGCASYVSGSQEFHLTNSASGDVIWPAAVPNQAGPVKPALQRQDGSYVGTAFSSSGIYMVTFNASGQVTGMASGGAANGYYPQIATSGGGVIATTSSGQTVTFGQNSNITGQMLTLPIQSWKGAYRVGSVESLYALLSNIESDSYGAVLAGNFSGNGTATKLPTIGLFWCGTGYGEVGACSDIK